MKNLVLFGFMGSGKSTVGKLAAEKLKLKFVDMDQLLEERHGCTIEEMFSIQGEAFFRQAESDLVAELSKQESLLISTGGGVVLRDENMALFKASGIPILLKVDAERAFERTRGSKRPLLKSEDPSKRVRELLEARMPLYAKISNVVDTINRPVADIVADVIQIYRLNTES